MLVMAQPDLGTALVYVAVALAAAVRRRHAVAALRGARRARRRRDRARRSSPLPAAGVHVLKPYQVERLTSFLHPSDVAGEEGYQQQQSKIAIGSGEKTGRGVETPRRPG